MFEEVHIEEVLLEFVRMMNENTKQYIAGSRRYGFLKLKIGRTIAERYNGSSYRGRVRQEEVAIPAEYLVAKTVPYYPDPSVGLMKNVVYEPEGDYWEIEGPDFLIEAVVKKDFAGRDHTYSSIHTYTLLDYYLVGEESAVKKEFAFIKLCHVDD